MPRSRVTFSPIGDGTRYAGRCAERPQPEDEGEEPAALAAQGKRGADGAERDHPQHLREAEERVLGLVPVDEEQRSLEQPDREQRRAHRDGAAVEAAPAREERGHTGQAEIEEGERREPGGHDGEHDGHPRPAELERLERPKSDGEAGRVRVRAREERPARHDGEHARGPARAVAPLPLGERGEERGGRHDGDQSDRVVADQRGREVVEEAVGEERIVARVPVRVPDEDAVLDELRSVQVGRKIAGRRAEQDEREPDDKGDHARDPYLSARERA